MRGARGDAEPWHAARRVGGAPRLLIDLCSGYGGIAAQLEPVSRSRVSAAGPQAAAAQVGGRR
jgi:hypothetical protein